MSPSITVRSPYDGREVGRVAAADAGAVDRAVAAARSCLEGGGLPAWRRAEILDTAARLLADREADLARTIADEAAKPIRTARVEAQRAVSTFTFAAVAARTLAGEVVPMDASPAGEGKLAVVLRLPIGVVGAITPFNFPLNLVAHKVAPAIAAGCPIVVKPASQTPLSALRLADILAEAGLPDGWLHVVCGSGSEVGGALVDHPDVPYLTFTGSAEVGWRLQGQAPRKKVRLELGNSTPVIIQPDGDWMTAAAKIAVAGFNHAGQSCISTQRVYVHHGVHDAFVAALAERADGLVVGDPLDEATDVSALISSRDTDRVRSWIDEAVAAGATVASGGATEHGMLRPTVLTSTTNDMKVCREEVFGPVVAVQAHTDLDDALQRANDTRYGLQAGIFTADIGSALAAARTLRFGGVTVNEVPTWRADQMPYGGVGESGNTREGPAYAVEEMTERRLVVIQP